MNSQSASTTYKFTGGFNSVPVPVMNNAIDTQTQKRAVPINSHLNYSLSTANQQSLPKDTLPFVSPTPPSTIAPPAIYSYHPGASYPGSSTVTVTGPAFITGTQNNSAMSVSPKSSDMQHEIPYTSVDGRRKRRRTTFEDAFQQCLTIDIQEDNVLVNDDITTPIKDCNYDSIFMNNDDENEPGNNGPFNYSSPSNCGNGYNSSHLKNGGNSEVSKRLAFNDYDAPSSRREPTLFRLSSTESTCMLDINHDQDDAAISSTSDPEYNRSSSANAVSSSSTPIIFAPRKAKKQVEHLDPVDERIEELIRHSRIKAMVLTNRGIERQAQAQSAHDQLKLQQMDEKEMDHGGERKEAASELRRKNEKEQSMFTGKSTDDSALPWTREGDSLRGMSPTSSVTLLHRDGESHSRSNSI